MKTINWRIIPFAHNSAALNMAIDEAIFRLYPELQVDTIRLYGWKPSAVSIGKHQSYSEEVDVHTLNSLGFNLVRRISGGGAVFHDELGEITYSIVTNVKNLARRSVESTYYELTDIIFEPLLKLGLTIDYAKIHCPSIFSEGKKISGNAQARFANTLLQHGTLLVDFRPELMYSVLKARPGVTRARMVQSVYQKITTISSRLEKKFLPEELASIMLDYWSQNYDKVVVTSKLHPSEEKLVQELYDTKYTSDEWNFAK
ncbi:MAG: lipoate--protein ligase family protein [Candidatus Hodarchaeales archaeon]